MTLACDIRIAAAKNKIAFPFVKRSLVNEGTSSYLLPRLVGPTQVLFDQSFSLHDRRPSNGY